MEELTRLRELLGTAEDVSRAAALLEWDQETYMPTGATKARARQVGTLRRLAHEHFTSDEVGTLLERLSRESLDEVSQDLIAVAQRDFDRQRKIPARLVQELAVASGEAKDAWRTARAENAFAQFAPHLERIIGLTIEKAESLGYDECRYDALLDEFEPDARTSAVEQLFAALRAELVPLVKAVGECPPPSSGFLFTSYDKEAQWAFGMDVLRALGFDLANGRQDLSAHPFSTSIAVTDVRITTRLDEYSLPMALFGTMHEAGHGLYGQGIDSTLEHTPLASGTSLGMHESQSRLWENQVGRSLPFWEHFYPKLQQRFGKQLGGKSLQDFYRAINRVAPSLIRVEADELTYNLHVMLRFELEQLMVNEEVSVAALPELWDDRMEAYLGIRPENPAEGVLQDIHWSLGAIGYFPTYTLGTLMSAQIFGRAAADLPDLNGDIARGDFAHLLEWLRTHIYQYGRRKSADELITELTGEPVGAAAWLAYAQCKFGSLYDLR